MKRQLLFSILLFTLLSTAAAQTETGYASWYGGKFQGRRTASGEIFDTSQLTAAHKTLPFGSLVKVTNLKNGETVEVKINDRGPFVEGRIIDLSMAAAQAIHLLGDGVGRVTIEVTGTASIHTAPPEAASAEPDTTGEASTAAVPEYYSIQVASFRLEKNARQLKESLTTNGFTPEYESSSEGYIRVVLPRFDADEIDHAVSTLSSLGHTSILVRSHFQN